jgi:hypothetical protein
LISKGNDVTYTVKGPPGVNET